MNAKLSRVFNYYGRTVLVKDKNPEQAVQVLNTRTRYHEKPFKTRFRVIMTQCNQVYDEDMDKKIKFLTKKNRVNAYPGYD